MQVAMDNAGHGKLFPTLYPENILAIKITAGITSILSVFGASLIILTYVAFKDLRTTARQLLVNLCIADIIVALSHFVGLFANFERFIPFYNNVSWYKSSYDSVCIAQAAFSIYGTVSSFMWSIMIAVYLLIIIVSGRLFIVKAVPLFYILSWGIPVILVIVNGVKRYMGFEPISNIGWCYTTMRKYHNSNRTCESVHHWDAIAGDVLGYEIWVDICLVALPVIYLIMFCYMRCKKKSDRKLQQVAKVDIKLLSIPVIFLLLRIWTTISNGILHYSKCNIIHEYKHSSVAAPALTILAGIGLNAQGFANAILFCVFTKQIRQRLLASFVKMYHVCVLCKWKEMYTKLPPSPSHTEEQAVANDTTKFINNVNGDDPGPVDSNSFSYGSLLINKSS